MRCGKLLTRQPLLPTPADELPLVLADRATRWRRGTFRKLRAALDAGEHGHGWTPQRSNMTKPAGGGPVLNRLQRRFGAALICGKRAVLQFRTTVHTQRVLCF